VKRKTYNYALPKYWTGGRGPSGEYNSSKKDFNAYLKDWDDFIAKIEKLTGLTVTGYDPGLNLTKIVDKKYIEGTTIQIPLWFAKILVTKFDDLELELFNAQPD
jgi:hypothetical protein